MILISSNDRGIMMIELSVLVPFVLLIVFTAIEIAHYLRVHQAVTTMSREAANMAFRECSESTDTEVQNCLNSKRDKIVSAAKISLPGFDISNLRITFIREASADPSNPSVPPVSLHDPWTSCLNALCSPPSNWPVRFPKSRFQQSQGDLANLIDDVRVVVTGEVSYPYRSILPGLSKFLIPVGGIVRDASIF